MLGESSVGGTRVQMTASGSLVDLSTRLYPLLTPVHGTTGHPVVRHWRRERATGVEGLQHPQDAGKVT